MIFNVDEARKYMFNEQELVKLNEKYIFFSDETGNCRKFSLEEGKVNSQEALYNDFILGGIVLEKEIENYNIDELFDKLCLQSNQKELKFRHIKGRNKYFFDIINQTKVTAILDWIIKNNIYIHYSILNNLYYALADIVDSLYDTHQDAIIMCENSLKATLFEFAKSHIDDFLKFLSKYEYPNINVNLNKDFCYELAKLIQTFNTHDQNFELEMLRQMLKTAGNSGNLCFLNNNESGKLIEEYYMIYQAKCINFAESQHYFDEEVVIRDNMDKISMQYKGKALKNYQFIDSAKNRFIQLSDVIVGLLGKLFYFLDYIDGKDYVNLLNEKYREARNNIVKINKIIDYSNKKCIYFIQNVSSIDLLTVRMKKLERLCELEI